MTENKKDLLINGHGPITIDPLEYPSEHMIVLGKCGTFGHKQIIKDMLMEEVKKIGDKVLDARKRRNNK